MTLFLQRLFDSFANGSVYAALAVAVSMVFGSTGVLNLAQGQLAMLSAYIAVVLAAGADQGLAFRDLVDPFLSGPLPVWLAIAAAVLVSMAIGALIERLLIRPLERDDPAAVVGATLGVYLLLDALVVRYFSSRTRILGTPFPDEAHHHFEIAGARLHFDIIGITLTMVVALVLLGVLRQRTRLGLAFRAVTANRESAATSGVRVERVLMAGWALAAGLGALGGGLIAGVIHVRPNMMGRLFVFALAAATLGGLRSPVMAFVGGYLFAFAETMLGGYVGFIDSQVTLVWALGVLVVVLSVRPVGLVVQRKGGRGAGDVPPPTMATRGPL